MGLFDAIFKNTKQPAKFDGYWDMLTTYRPIFSTWNGNLYESELVRSAIDSRARHISKLKAEFTGSAKPKMVTGLAKNPNELQTWGQFLYRLSTILDMQNTAFIVPVFDDFNSISGVFPIMPQQCEVVSANGNPWIRYKFSTGMSAAVRLDEIGIMTKFQYEDDLYGSKNSALRNTMQLIEIQNKGIEEAVKNSATYRFMAQVNNFAKPDDLEKERKRFSTKNFAKDGGGLLLFPNTYTNIQQVKNSPFTVDAEQMRLIQQSVYNYFGVNEKIIQNIATGDEWSAFYEGAIETFSVQLSDVLTRMLFTNIERARGSQVIFTANRMQYMSNQDKLNVSSQMADRGIMTINEIREIWTLAPVDGGDVRIMRGEYKNSEETEEDYEEIDEEEIEDDEIDAEFEALKKELEE